MPITVKTSVYEGPLDLLLDLIEKRKLLINDISLSQVADEYLEKVRAMPELPVGDTAQFISLAATLLLIKSRSLLPTLDLSTDERRDIKELEYRLAVYQLVKETGKRLERRLGRVALYEGNPPESEPLFIPDNAVTLVSLRTAAQALIEGFPTTLTLAKVAVKKIISLEEVISTLASRVSSAMTLSFKKFTAGSRERHDIIVGFLALLELVKQGIINATQQENDIILEADSVKAPRYE